jgi:DNA replication protein DnaC
LLKHAGGDRVMAQVLTAIPLHGLEAVLVAVELALQSGRVSAEHVLNLLSRLAGAAPGSTGSVHALVLKSRHRPMCCATTGCARSAERTTMSNDIVAAFKALSLHGMASAWPEMLGTARMKALDHETVMHQLLKAERAQREVRSMAYQMRAARFPAHRDLDGFAFDQASVDEALVRELHQMRFLDSAHNVVLVGGPGTGKTHLATSLGIEAIRVHGKRVRFFSTVELVNALEQEKVQGRTGQMAHRLMYVDLVILDETGLPAVHAVRRGLAVPPAVQVVREDQRGDHHQPELLGMGQRVWRRQDDHGACWTG